MKIRFNSISFKTIIMLLLTSAVFIAMGYYVSKNIFSKNYESVIDEKTHVILKSISPQISINLSYGFKGSIDSICAEQMKDTNILLIKIDSNKLKEPLIYKKSKDTTLSSSMFLSSRKLIDPSTSDTIGKVTLLYSSVTYDKKMEKFHEMATLGVVLFLISIFFISLFLLNSLKPLSKLAQAMKDFDPSDPKKLNIASSSNNEIGSIINSANKMIENLMSFLEHSSSLTYELSKQQQHLKEAQRIASAGSWEYNVITNKLVLSDEIYRTLGMKKDSEISWGDFLGFIAKDDYEQTVSAINESIKNGSVFNLKYKLNLNNGKTVYVSTKGKVRKKNSNVKVTAVTVDITKDIQNEQTIEKLAYYDSLTHLPNRILFKDRTKTAIINAKNHNSNIAVMFLDLDNFKIVNDTLGHSIGDKLLIYVANLLQSILRENDTISRVGGDEFTILLTDINSENEAKKVAQKIFEALEGEHLIGSHKLLISTSLGIAIYPNSGKDIDMLIRNADTAMYEAKKADKNNYKIFNDQMHEKINHFVQIEQDLRQSLNNEDAFEIFYQPKMRSDNSTVSGCEALVRWRHPEKGIVYPDDFINVAEESGLIIPIGNIIIDKAIKDISEFHSADFKNLKVAINLSAKQFSDQSLIDMIHRTILKYNVDPSYLEFEITESLSMQNISKTLEVLNRLKTIGVSIAIDDFGTGYSSLSYLKQFPINTLKIDKSFVLDMTYDSDDKSIVNTIINMAHTLNFKTVAEGVETKEHVKILKDMQCDELQGFYFSKPINKHDFINFLQTYNPN